MDEAVVKLLREAAKRKRKVAELKSVIAMLNRLVPVDEKLLNLAKKELAGLESPVQVGYQERWAEQGAGKGVLDKGGKV